MVQWASVKIVVKVQWRWCEPVQELLLIAFSEVCCFHLLLYNIVIAQHLQDAIFLRKIVKYKQLQLVTDLCYFIM
jgi:hypothetical protein